MQLLHLTSVRRNKALVFVASTLLMILLAWQLSVKTTAIEKTFVAANQSAVDVTELKLNIDDFDQAIPATLLQLGEFYGWVEPVSTLLTATFSHIAVPQSRAPPLPL